MIDGCWWMLMDDGAAFVLAPLAPDKVSWLVVSTSPRSVRSKNHLGSSGRLVRPCVLLVDIPFNPPSLHYRAHCWPVDSFALMISISLAADPKVQYLLGKFLHGIGKPVLYQGLWYESGDDTTIISGVYFRNGNMSRPSCLGRHKKWRSLIVVMDFSFIQTCAVCSNKGCNMLS